MTTPAPFPYRNPVYGAVAGTIECEINHPVYGWMPYTANANDGDEVTCRQMYVAIVTAATSVPIAPYVATAPTVDDVVTERARRLALGYDYNFGDVRGTHHIGMTDADKTGWEEVKAASDSAIQLGQPGAVINIVTNTGPVAITAMEWQQIVAAGTLARQPIWAASFALQTMSPIPANYTADSYWQ